MKSEVESNMFKISTNSLEEPNLKSSKADQKAGGFVTFKGRVRDTSGGRRVVSMEYETYSDLAEKEGERILAEAREKFGIMEAHCRHRSGRLAPGETAVWVEVAAAHRKEAFEACQFIIAELKYRLPIWKKEYYEDGDSGWVQSESGEASAQ